jgi:hypothetical protein
MPHARVGGRVIRFGYLNIYYTTTVGGGDPGDGLSTTYLSCLPRLAGLLGLGVFTMYLYRAIADLYSNPKHKYILTLTLFLNPNPNPNYLKLLLIL